MQRARGRGGKTTDVTQRCSAVRQDLSIAIVAIAVLLLTTFAAFLSFDAQGRNRACFETFDSDLFARFEAVAVGAVFYTLQCFFNLADQLAFTIARTQFETEVLFLCGSIVRIGEVRDLVLNVRDGPIDFHHQIALPAFENLPKVIELLAAHVLLAALDDVRLYVTRTG